MGLPLFVEPVESDLATKTGTKTRAGSPNRTDSRRPGRSEIRDRRSSTRRAGVRIYGPAQRAMPRNARERFLPWVESPVPRDQDANGAAERRSGMFREALREMTGSDQRRRERIEERMNSLFGNSWRDAAPTSTTQPENMSEGVDLGWWSMEPRLPQARRAGDVAYGAPQPERNAEATQLLTGDSSLVIDPLRPMFGGPSGTEDQARASLASLSRHAARLQGQPPMVRSLSARQMMPGRRAGSGLDGLGDRDRSLSPEVWDTLLSTLTPDPQPPSAGSSFASVTASQTAGPSTSTPTSAPDMAEESTLDPPCESGCENSDLELDDADYEPPEYAQIRRRREQLENSSRRIPNYNLDGLADSSFSRRMGVTERRATRQIRTPNGPLTIYESTGRLGSSADALRSQRTSSPSPRQGVWIGQLSVGAQGVEEHGSSTNQGNPMAAEEDWSGMQRIVRSLARREDIPDEWWAEAGLSRTLGQGDVVAAAASGNGILRQ